MNSIEEKIKNAAKLAKIDLGPEDLSDLIPKAQKIFDSFENISEVDTKDVEPLYTFLESFELRPDEAETQFSRDELMSLAPKSASNHFVVSRVVGEGDS